MAGTTTRSRSKSGPSNVGVTLADGLQERYPGELEFADERLGMSDIVRVEFYGGEIEAVKVGDDIWVSVRRACEHLGIAPNNQIEKLKEKAWARSMITISHDAKGRKQDAFMLHLDSLPMWLATISENRVAKGVRFASSASKPFPKSWGMLLDMPLRPGIAPTGAFAHDNARVRQVDCGGGLFAKGHLGGHTAEE
jgi:hypothetical protein